MDAQELNRTAPCSLRTHFDFTAQKQIQQLVCDATTYAWDALPAYTTSLRVVSAEDNAGCADHGRLESLLGPQSPLLAPSKWGDLDTYLLGYSNKDRSDCAACSLQDDFCPEYYPPDGFSEAQLKNWGYGQVITVAHSRWLGQPTAESTKTPST